MSQNNTQTAYVAFLRGINVGGNRKVEMKKLQEALTSLGFENVKTFLASGNVFFETAISKLDILQQKIQEKLKKTFGFEIGILLRTLKDLQDLSTENPFQKIPITPETRLYVTFLAEKPKTSLQIPYESSDKNFKIIRCSDSEICSVLTLEPGTRTVDLMAVLEKEFGRSITTRNWNTLTKIMNYRR